MCYELQLFLCQVTDTAEQRDLQPKAVVHHARAVPHEVRLGR